jgi:lipopolysaccharide export system permease protein
LKLVTRYLLREHVGPLVFAVATLTSLLLLNYISKRFGDLVGKGLPWKVIAEFFVLSIPFTVAMTLPMAVLIATLYAFSRLAGDSEITAFMASGISTRRLLTPVIVGGFALSMLMVAFNDQFLPRTNYRLASLSMSIAQKKPTLALRPQTLNEVTPGRFYIWMSRIDRGENIMHTVTIYDFTDVQIHRTIVADSALLAFAPNGRDLLLTLYKGYTQETKAPASEAFQKGDNGGWDFRRVFFATDLLRVRDVANSLSRSDEPTSKGDREMTVCEMQQEVRSDQVRREKARLRLMAFAPESAQLVAPKYGSRIGEWYCSAIARLRPSEAQAAQVPAQEVRAQEVRAQEVRAQEVAAQEVAAQEVPAQEVPAQEVPRGGASGFPQGVAPPKMPDTTLERAIRANMELVNVRQAELRINQFEVEIQKKFAISLACLVFALIGPPVAMRFPRAGVGLTIGVSMSVFAVYYVGLIAGERLGDRGTISPALAMWGADIIFGVIGVILALRMGRQGAHTRGSNLLELLFGRRHRRRRTA